MQKKRGGREGKNFPAGRMRGLRVAGLTLVPGGGSNPTKEDNPLTLCGERKMVGRESLRTRERISRTQTEKETGKGGNVSSRLSVSHFLETKKGAEGRAKGVLTSRNHLRQGKNGIVSCRHG